MAEAQKGVWLSISAYLILALGKIGYGLWSGSQGIFADGINNSSDIFLSLALLIGVRVAVQPADEDHHYGHSKAETVSVLIAASFMVLVGINVAIQAILNWVTPEPIKAPILGITIAMISAGIMLGVTLYNFRLSRKTRSMALQTAAKDNFADALVSIGAVVGITGRLWGVAWLDPLAALLIGLFVVYTGWKLGDPAVHQLMDRVDQSQLDGIAHQVLEIHGIHEVIQLLARHHGSDLYIEITVGVHPHLSVAESHHLTTLIEEKLIGYQGIKQVHVHVEPV